MTIIEPLIERHRPRDFAEVCGHRAAVAALVRRLAEPGRPHAYLFTGPSGVGKTTLALLIGRVLESDVLEVDAASNNGVDAMRAVTELGYHMAPGAASRLIILDECHMLSRSAWNAILNMLERPPAHLYLALCTTEPAKVPETIETRCYHVPLARLKDQEIEDFLIDIIDREGWGEVTLPDVFRLVVREANGSPRRALSLLQAVYDATDVDEAARIVALETTDNLRQVLAIVLAGTEGGWKVLQPRLVELADEDFSEASLNGACRYVIGAMNRQETEDKARRLWQLLACLTYPSRGFDPKATFYAAIGRMLWAPE